MTITNWEQSKLTTGTLDWSDNSSPGLATEKQLWDKQGAGVR